jgi:hypothetical protein
MLPAASPTTTLAHWQYTANEWREFVDYEMQARLKTSRSYRNAFLLILLVAGAVMISLVLIPFLSLGIIWRADVWGPVIGVGFVAGILLMVVGIYWILARNKIASLNLPNGDVYVTLTGVCINGVWFNWGYEKVGWRLHTAKRKTITVPHGRNIEILEFKCSARNKNSRVNSQLTKAERILIPTGKSAEAERVVERLMAEKNRFAENYAY